MEATNRLSLSRFTPTCRAFWRSNRIVKTKELRLLASSYIARLFIDNRVVLQQDTEKSSDVGNTSVLQPILLFACTWYARKSLLRSIVESRLRWILLSRRNIENKFFCVTLSRFTFHAVIVLIYVSTYHRECFTFFDSGYKQTPSSVSSDYSTYHAMLTFFSLTV